MNFFLQLLYASNNDPAVSRKPRKIFHKFWIICSKVFFIFICSFAHSILYIYWTLIVALECSVRNKQEIFSTTGELIFKSYIQAINSNRDVCLETPLMTPPPLNFILKQMLNWLALYLKKSLCLFKCTNAVKFGFRNGCRDNVTTLLIHLLFSHWYY